MLTYLRITNLAVIDDVALELEPGLTVFTGETGAGKSIILGGLGLVLGERAALDQIRDGKERASVEAVFTAPRDPQLVALLDEAGLSAEGGGIVVRRVLTASGSRAYVNDQLTSLQTLKEIGDRLVDLHGQHEHQSLLSLHAHRELLDRFAGLDERRSAVAAAFDAAREAAEKVDAVNMDERDRVQRIDLLRFQVQEIESATLSPGEDAELEAERLRLAHAEELQQLGAEAVAAMYEEESSAATLLARAERNVARLKELDPNAPGDTDAISGARFAAEETARVLQGYLEDLQVDPDRLEHVEARLATLHGLQRKYGDDIAAIIEHAAAARAELEALEQHDQRREALQHRLEEAVDAYLAAADHLSAARRRAAASLEKQVLAELAELAMEGAAFEVSIAPRRGARAHGLPKGAARTGLDRIELELAANPGGKPGALNKVASGGELSRVMLALKLTASDGDPLETMIFDEIDSGIGGGRVAEHLAQRLAALGESHQVLVVTHLPQVAAYADNHVAIDKVDNPAGGVSVRARRLDEGEQVDELARMLGGLEVTDATRRHAREMLAVRR